MPHEEEPEPEMAELTTHVAEVSVVPRPPGRPGWWRRWTAAALRRYFASADLRQDERQGWVVDVRLLQR